MNNKPSGIKNSCALRYLILAIAFLTLGGWWLWFSQSHGNEPPLLAFASIVLAAVMLLDNCQ